MPTAKDIARELNLSQPTVSRILSGAEDYRAARSTRERVWEAAHRMGYQPNAVARSLRLGRTGMIGVYTSHNYDVRNDFLGAVVGALQRACAVRHLDVLLHSGGHGPSDAAMFGKLRDHRIDGLILHACVDDELVAMLHASSLPVVAVADALPGLASVTCDDEAGMSGLIELLWARGHRKFVFLAPRVELTAIERRRVTFECELQTRQVAPKNRVVQRMDFEVATPLANELRARGPVAVCCWNDRTAYNLLAACLALGVQVPQEIAIAGFDGLRAEKIPARLLATVSCPWEQVANCALETLVQRIEARATAKVSSGQEIRLPVTVLDGDTI